MVHPDVIPKHIMSTEVNLVDVKVDIDNNLQIDKILIFMIICSNGFA